MLAYHGEFLFYRPDGLFKLRFPGKKITFSLAIADYEVTVIFNSCQQSIKVLQGITVLFQQICVNAFACKFCQHLFVKLLFLPCNLLIAGRRRYRLLIFKKAQFIIETFHRLFKQRVKFLEVFPVLYLFLTTDVFLRFNFQHGLIE